MSLPSEICPPAVPFKPHTKKELIMPTIQQKKIARRRSDVPVKYQGIYDKAMSGHSRAMGVKAFCLECMGWSIKDSADCNTVECPLHPYNPYLSRQDPTERGLAERQSTNGPPVVLGSQIATQSVRPPNKGQFRKER